MTEDQMYRAAASGAAVAFWALLFQKAEAYFTAYRNKHGRGFTERIGYWLGQRWASRHRARQKARHRG